MTIQDLETALGITIVGTPQEARYTMALESAKSFAISHCNQEFPDGFPVMAIAMIVKSMLENPGVQSQSLGDMSKSFFEGGTLKAAKQLLKPYKRVVFV